MFYQPGFAFAFFSGLLIGLLGFTYQLSNAQSLNASEPSAKQRASFRDARIVACILLLPQGMLLSFTYRFIEHFEIDGYTLALARIFLMSALVCLWVWLLTKIGKSDVRSTYFSFLNLLIFSGPALLSLLWLILVRNFHI